MNGGEGLYLKQIEVGPMGNFVYFIGDAQTREVFIVDPAWQIDTLSRLVQSENLKVTGALISHGHYDHCNGLDDLLERFDVPIYVHKEETDYVRSYGNSGGLFGDLQGRNIRKTSSGDKLRAGGVEITLMHTPGHTPGSQCFLVQNSLVSGDTLFIRGCGRSDLPGGNAEQLYESLTQKLLKLPEDTLLFPGHNYADEPSSTLRLEKAKNPYLMGSLDTFLSLVGR